MRKRKEAEKLSFTKKSLNAIKPAPEGTRLFYRDNNEKTPRGLMLQVTDKGAKSFQVYRWIGGRPERITIGRFPDLSIEQARAEAERINGGIAQKKRPEELRQSRRGEWTLAEMLDDFLANKRNRRGAALAEKTQANYRGDFERYAHRLGVLKLSEVRAEDVAAMHSRIGKEAPYAANRVLALISSLYGYAKKRGIYRLPNPASGIQKFPEDKRERVVAPEEMPYLFQALTDEPTDYRDVFLLGLLTGARRGNVLSMRWPDLHLERAEWRIPKVKGGGAHTVPLVAEAAAILKRREPQEHDEESEGFVFPGRGGKGHLVEVKGAWRRILHRAELLRLLEMIAERAKWSKRDRDKAYQDARSDEVAALKKWRAEARKLKLDPKRASIGDLRIHDLRRSVGSALAATGANIAMTMQALGHKTVSASLIYQRLHRDPIREAMQKATSRLLDQAGIAATIPDSIKHSAA